MPSLHRGGLRFPEQPYRDLIETEGFGALAKDLGVVPVGLPRVEIFTCRGEPENSDEGLRPRRSQGREDAANKNRAGLSRRDSHFR